jgi:transposase
VVVFAITAQSHNERRQAMSDYNMYCGLDVHQNSVVVAVAEAGAGRPEPFGRIPNTELAVAKLTRQLAKIYGRVAFCYEAGPCGYGIYRQLRSMGHDCMVAAPSLIPRKPGERIKTDPRDARSLARQLRAGELTAVWVPTEKDEAMRDLSRAREDLKIMERQVKQRLYGLLLRHGKRFSGKTKGTQAFFRWLEEVKLPHPEQQIVLEEYVDAVKQTKKRVKALEEEMAKACEGWIWEPLVVALMALRGVSFVAAFTLVAEIGDFTRFVTAVQFMTFLGLIPSEQSSGEKRWRGPITKTGNSHARRILVEAAWTYRFRARKTAVIQRRAEKCSDEVQAIAWKAQKRLCARYRHMVLQLNKPATVACTAIARELAAFVWAIAREVAPVCLAQAKSS